MSLPQIGAKIVLNGEQEYRQAMTNINANLKLMVSELKLLDAQYSDNAKSTEAIKAKTEALNKILEEQKIKAQTAAGALDSATKKQQDAAQVAEKLKKELEKENAELARLKATSGTAADAIEAQEKAVTTLSIKYGHASKAVDNASNNIKSWQSRLAATNGEILATTRALDNLESSTEDSAKAAGGLSDIFKANLFADLAADGVRQLISALVDLSKKALDTGVTYEAAMSQVAATLGMTVEETNAGSAALTMLDEAARAAGESTKYTATEAAQALNYLALAGYDAEEATGMLGQTLDLAAAGNMDVATATDMFASAVKSLGLGTEDATMLVDQMTKTAQSSNTNVAQLGEAMTKAAVAGDLLGMSTTDINTALGILANNGIKAEEAGTTLQATIKKLITPTDAAKEALAKLGVETLDSKGNFRDLNDILIDFKEGLSGLSEGEQAEALGTIFETRGMVGAVKLINSAGDAYADLRAKIEDSAGAAADMSATMINNVQGATTIMKSAAEGFALSIYDDVKPALFDLATMGQESFTKLKEAYEAGGIDGMADQLLVEIDGFRDKLKEYAPSVAEVISTLITTAFELVVQSLPDLAETGVAIVGNVAQSLVDNIPLLVDTVLAVIDELATLLVDNADKIIDGGVKLFNGLNIGLAKVMPKIIDALPGLITKITEAFVKGAMQLIMSANDTAMAMQDEFGDTLDDQDFFAGIGLTVGGAVVDGICTALENFGPQWKAYWQKLGSEIYYKDIFGNEYGISDEQKEQQKKADQDLLDAKKELNEKEKREKEAADNLVKTWAGKQEKAQVRSNVFNETYAPPTHVTMDSELADLNTKLSLHKITEEQFYADMKNIATKYRDEESAAWWETQDKVEAYYTKKNETAAKEAEKAAAAAQKAAADNARAAKEAATAATNAAKESYDELEKQYARGEIDRKTFNSKYAALVKSWGNTQKDVAYDTAKKVEKINEDKAKEEFKALREKYDEGLIDRKTFNAEYAALVKSWGNACVEAEKEAQKAITEIDKKEQEDRLKLIETNTKDSVDVYKKQVDEIQSKIDSMKSSIGTKFSDLFGIEKKADGKNYAEFTTGEAELTPAMKIAQQRNELEAYDRQLQALRDRGVDSSIMDQFSSLGLDEGVALANTLSKMSDKDLEKMAKEWEAYQKQLTETATAPYEAQLKTAQEELLNALTDTLASDDFKDVTTAGGKELIAKMIEGLKEGAPLLEAAYTDLVKKTAEGKLDEYNPKTKEEPKEKTPEADVKAKKDKLASGKTVEEEKEDKEENEEDKEDEKRALEKGKIIAQKIELGAKEKAGELFPGIVESLGVLFEEAEEELDKQENNPKTLGVYMAQGIADGIAAGTHLITEVLNNTSDEMLKAIKKKFGIKSPSRVFRDEVGVHLAAGLGEGFEQQMQVVKNQMADSLNAADVLNGVSRSSLKAPAALAVASSSSAQSTNFTQNNYSPKALTPYEIKKNTQAMFNLHILK